MTESLIEDILPLAPLQEGLLFRAQYENDGEDPYLVQVGVELSGRVDPQALRAALNTVLRRHPNLRSGFRGRPSTGEAIQIVSRAAEVPWHTVDLGRLEAAGQTAEAERLLCADAGLGFDMATPPLLRAMLITFGPDRHRLILTYHHIILDGWSFDLVLSETLRAYLSGGDADGLGSVTPYRDYLAWLTGQDSAAARRAWRDYLAELGEPTLVADGSGDLTGSESGQVLARLPAELTARLRETARSHGLTVNSVIQGSWGLVLGHLLGRADVVFGATVNGRPPELPGFERMVGLFINTLPIRIRTDPDATLARMFLRVQDEQKGMTPHHFLGLAEIQGLSGHRALFDSTMFFQNYPSALDELAGLGGELEVTGMKGRDFTHYPLVLTVRMVGDCLRVSLQFASEVFDETSIGPVLERMVQVLEAFATDSQQKVGDLEPLSPAAQGRQPVLPSVPERNADGAQRPAPDHQTDALEGSTPDDQQTEIIRKLFCEVLRVEHVEPGDDFFALGGHSLLAMRLISRVRSATGVGLSIREFFAAPTIAGVAAGIASGATAGAAPRPVLGRKARPDQPGGR
jgi:nonribosomal peptide synthetase DhbF